MSTLSRQAVTPKAQPNLLPRLWLLLSMTPLQPLSSGPPSLGEGFRAWLYSFEDYCDAFNLPDSARLREVGSKLCDNAHIWHHNMLFETWEEWETKARKRFIGYKPDPHHFLSQAKISQFTSLQPFIVKFQEYANKGSSGIEQKIISDNFHSLVGIPTFENALTPAYAGLIRKANLATLEEAYNIVCENYAIYVECKLDNKQQKKDPSIAETIEAKFKDMQSQFEAIYLAHEHPSCGPRPMQGHYVFTGNCYNCDDQGQKLERCTKPCSICKSTDHTNFSCNQRMRNTTQCPIAVMMADQYYQNEKRPLTTPESVSPLNKKNSSDYSIYHSGPVISPLIKPRHIRS
ncbi:hypothetical protein DSO57_1014729 [Entomophthora muscae]|uniref:Uncharacterized protein n=1 Tax=Entomophthora muscae TaxID=34485 RepID=A0ACC2U3T9_9FUNG|nr:hypothetical protein DSO57_1014729 [Entomophthora muscae]